MTAPAEDRVPHGGESPLVEVRDLVKHFRSRRRLLLGAGAGAVRAVDGVSFAIPHGQTLGLVGESGCGKSTTGRMLVRLIEPTAGSIHFDGQDVLGLDWRATRAWRRQAQIMFQDPYGALDPRMTARQIIAEPFLVAGGFTARERERRVRETMDVVGLAAHHADRYPHEFSGGQRQRIGIARALALRPSFIVCDEPVSALDVSTQAQVINLLQDLQASFGLTYLLISHDLGVVHHIANRVAVMYLGQIVEIADNERLYRSPLHPYTQALLSAVPVPDPARRPERIILKGDVPSPIDPPSGCRFHTRCPLAMPLCRERTPPLRPIRPGHEVACHLVEPETAARRRHGAVP